MLARKLLLNFSAPSLWWQPHSSQCSGFYLFFAAVQSQSGSGGASFLAHVQWPQLDNSWCAELHNQYGSTRSTCFQTPVLPSAGISVWSYKTRFGFILRDMFIWTILTVLVAVVNSEVRPGQFSSLMALQLKSEDRVLQGTSAPRLINTGSFQPDWQLNRPRQCVFFFFFPLQRDKTKWHLHSQGTGEMWNYPHHLPMVFATLAFKIMKSCRQTHRRKHHFTTPHSCSTSAARV